MFVYLRPGLYNFLEALSENFELVLFNNSSKEFTDAIVRVILENSPSGRKDYFSHVLSKEHCSVNDSGQEIKNLDHFCTFDSNREINDCLIVDNSVYCFSKHLTNGLLIQKYEGATTDDWLPALQNYITEKFAGEGSIIDVRKTISNDFSFEDIVSNTRTSMIR